MNPSKEYSGIAETLATTRLWMKCSYYFCVHSHTIILLSEDVDIGTPVENVQYEVGSREQFSTHPAMYNVK